MTRLYVVPVGDDWIGRFRRTVSTPVEVPDAAPEHLQRDEAVRIWGTTEGPQKRTFFEEMEAGDPLLFYHEGQFFAVGRAGATFESPEAGADLWDNDESRFLFTVTDYEEISVPRERVADLLGYDESWIPYGFLRASEDAIDSLLQRYNSIEEAVQDFQSDDGPTGPPEEEDSEDEPTVHTEIQWRLVQLGLAHGYDVYVATNDKNRTYEGERLGEDCVENLNLPGFSDAARRIIEYVDVIWLDGDFIVKLFEVESTTSIYSGILRMTDFVVKVPNIAVDMHIVASEADKDKVRQEIDRPTFQHVLGQSANSDLRYRSFEQVRETHETVQRAGPLQQVF